MKEDFCTYEQAFALKKLGFRERCLYFYNLQKQFVGNQFISDYEGQPINTYNLLDSINQFTKSNISCDAPTLAQAQKWLREEKNLSVEPFSDTIEGNILEKRYTYVIVSDINSDCIFSKNNFNSYEQALSVGITECLKLLEK